MRLSWGETPWPLAVGTDEGELMGAWKLRDGGAEKDVAEGLRANDSGQDSFKKVIVDTEQEANHLSKVM